MAESSSTPLQPPRREQGRRQSSGCPRSSLLFRSQSRIPRGIDALTAPQSIPPPLPRRPALPTHAAHPQRQYPPARWSPTEKALGPLTSRSQPCHPASDPALLVGFFFFRVVGLLVAIPRRAPPRRIF